MSPLIPNGYPVNRTQIRAMGKEFDKIHESVFNIEDVFLAQLFDNNKYTYHELYSHFLGEYKMCMKYLKKVVKPKYFTLDENYFSKKYKPIENDTYTGISAEAAH